MSGSKPISFVKETAKDDPMGAALKAAFERGAAADAISAVLAPTTSVADSQPESGLEDVVEPKDNDMEKRSDDEWEIADAIPITMTTWSGTS